MYNKECISSIETRFNYENRQGFVVVYDIPVPNGTIYEYWEEWVMENDDAEYSKLINVVFAPK